ncbi:MULTISPECIES: hypothetical protein [Burkholderiaceae]|jgi:ABC-type nickel/cobalt efflux system permease component RcnA|uniref:hypothetical protein n=1 Tax=Burkholderiaceae TaxID=119060 RepID=UPI0009683B68|nr:MULTISPECIES: hypothetical protein [Burkholderiaceae]MCG1017273.1 hypothetical protein [Mycetohabitans sp. B4]SIT70916.1 hypothetical protein SAMN04487768_2091 [Burkholderia sp. b13]
MSFESGPRANAALERPLTRDELSRHAVAFEVAKWLHIGAAAVIVLLCMMIIYRALQDIDAGHGGQWKIAAALLIGHLAVLWAILRAMRSNRYRPLGKDDEPAATLLLEGMRHDAQVQAYCQAIQDEPRALTGHDIDVLQRYRQSMSAGSG